MNSILKLTFAAGFASMLLVNCGGTSSSSTSSNVASTTDGGGTAHPTSAPLLTATGTIDISGTGLADIVTGAAFSPTGKVGLAQETTVSGNTNYTFSTSVPTATPTTATSIAYVESITPVLTTYSLTVISGDTLKPNTGLKTWTLLNITDQITGVTMDKVNKKLTLTNVQILKAATPSTSLTLNGSITFN